METTIAHLTAALSERYLIERKLGEGGMASVYLARDVKHDRLVAIKVLKPELASALGAERFLSEIRMTAKLSHPRILQLIDSGNADGILYYVMPFVDGESLRGRMDRENQLALDKALDITQQVADALSYAHARGIIHRDIKPENILLENGHARVADFGVARAITESGDTRITETGIAVGTPTYMSPEQSTAEREIDARSDVYSLACVAYEMLVGEPPFVAPNARALIARRLTETPRAVGATRERIPPAVDLAIAKALARAPADRYASVEQFALALRSATVPPPVRSTRTPVVIGVGIVVAVLVILGAVVARRFGEPSGGGIVKQPRIAVLPFENLGRAEDEAFTGGITDEITARLAEISALRVVSRTSAKRFKGNSASMNEVGKALNADYVLEGTVRTDHAAGGAGTARVTPRLIRVSDDVHVWEHLFDAPLVPGEIFRVQADIATKVAAAMNVTLLEPEKGRVSRASTSDSAAYRLYQLGRFQWEKRTPESLTLAKEYFQKAIDRDPTFARAHAGLGDATFILAFTVKADSGYREASQAIVALRRAVALDGGLAEAWAGLGYALAFGNWEWSKADSALKRAIALDPTYAPARYWYGQVLAVTGSLAEGLAQVKEAVSLDPLSVVAHSNLGMMSAAAGQHDQARAALERAIELQPTYAIAYWALAIEYARIEQRQRAEDALRRYSALLSSATRGADDRLISDVVSALIVHRDTTKSVARLLAAGVVRGNSLSAQIFALTGSRDSAFARLRKTISMHSLQLVPGIGNIEPILKDDPRWVDVIKSVGLTR